jgi:ribonuclease D
MGYHAALMASGLSSVLLHGNAADVEYEFISNQRDLNRFCRTVGDAPVVAFDTEFVSEDRYRPELCLVQVAVAERFAVIDPLAIKEMTPFWELLSVEGRETIAHAGRQELCFCLEATGKRPARLFDTQIAAGLIGLEYPAAYSTLLQKLLNKALGKGETRTDWRRRPLSQRQIEYAVLDVMHLEPLRDLLYRQIEALGRTAWFWDEMDQWQSQIEQAEYSERWRRMAGLSGLSPKSLAIVRELWLWRDAEAKHLDRPPRRILRDDLIVEMAKRGLADIAALKVLRGMNHRDKQHYLESVSSCIERAIHMPPDQWPRTPRRKSSRPRLNLLGQFLATALSSVCHAQNVAPSLVGTVDDVRDLIAWHLRLEGFTDGHPPSLACGWRCEVVGRTIEEVLSGKLAIRVGDALGDHPLSFEPLQDTPR